jgi:hypothetical protein
MPLSDPPSPVETTAKALVSLVPVVDSPALVIWEDLRERVIARMDVTATEILEAVNADDLARRMAESPEFEALVVNALERASRTGYEPKRRLLGRVVINAALDDAMVDRSQLVEIALRDLDAPRVRALERIRSEYDAVHDPGEDEKLDEGRGSPATQIMLNRRADVAIEASRREPAAVVAVLIRTGVAEPAMMGGGGIGVARVTKFGRDLLSELRDAAR